MTRRLISRPHRTASLATTMIPVLLATFAWLAPDIAVAGSRCHDYCSGPHKNFQDCMDRCTSQEEASHPWRAERTIRELCASKGHSEDECLREHGLGY